MEYPIGELCDRLSIAMLKAEKIQDVVCEKELNALLKEVPMLYKTFVEHLYEINAQIWNLEADVRNGKEGVLGMEEVGRRAIAIRELNKQRVAIKNKIVELTNTGFKDIKMNHASE